MRNYLEVIVRLKAFSPRLVYTILSPLIILIMVIALISASGGTDDYLKFYEYDRNLPLNAEVSKLRETERFVVYKVYYDSVNAQRVPALFIVPKVGKPPYPCIIFLHGYGGRKEDALTLAEFVCKEGYAILAIDAVYHGERRVEGATLYSTDLERTKRGFIQTVIDLRRAVDFLETRNEIDPNKIGYAGGSMGGIIGAIFIGVEPRVKAAVLVVPGGNISLMVRKSQHPAIPPIREYLRKAGISYEELQKIMDPIDPLNFIWRFAPRPVQFHIGKYDEIVPTEAGKQLYERAGEPKEVYWYDAGHNVPLDLVLARALDFFDRHLKGKRIIIPREYILRLSKLLPLVAPILAALAIILVAYLRFRKG